MKSLQWDPIGSIATGLGPGANVRFADIDGDSFDDFIHLHPNGGTTIYRNVYGPENKRNEWEPLPEADAPGISQRPEEIKFYDVNGDGLADYIWTRPIDGSVHVWLNQYPKQPAWHEVGEIAEGVGTSGNNMRFATLQLSGRPDYLAMDRKTGSLEHGLTAVTIWVIHREIIVPSSLKGLLNPPQAQFRWSTRRQLKKSRLTFVKRGSSMRKNSTGIRLTQSSRANSIPSKLMGQNASIQGQRMNLAG
ncbi:Fc.00g004020.m01.CDS01 [Cosmosporella sp. VM-42]